MANIQSNPSWQLDAIVKPIQDRCITSPIIRPKQESC